MPFAFGGTGTGGGDGVISLGPSPDVFGDATTANRAAAETLRNTQATNDAAWLALYDGNLNFWIRLVWNGGVVEQRRNAAGTDWEDVTNIVRGRQGLQGDTGEFRQVIYINTAIDLTAAPTGGSYVVATRTFTPPTNWTAAVATPNAGETTYESYAIIDPAAGGTITPTWSVPQAQGQGAQGAFRLQIFQNAATNPGTPTGGSYNVGTGVLTLPASWAATATAPGMNEETFVSEAFINPEIQSGDVTPTWNYPYEHGAASQLFTIVDVTGVGPPAASASTIPHLYLDTEIPRAWLTQAERIYMDIQPMGDFATFTRAGYIGDYRSLPPSSAVNAVGDIWYRHGTTHAWYQVTRVTPSVLSSQVNSRTALGATTTWLGDQPNRQAALDHIANFDNTRTYVFFNEDTSNVEELDNNSYTAQTVTLDYTYTTLELVNDVFDSIRQVLTAGANVTIDIDEDAGTITINASGGGGGLSTVVTDITITGDGSSGSPLSVAIPFTAANRTKLSGIEDNATADQTGAEIKTAYEGEADTNAFTDALLTKLNGIADDATDVSIQDVLDQIMAGTNITIDRTTDGQITVTAAGGGGGGSNWSSGTADPTGGAAGDGYLQVDGSDVLQSIWLNISGTWTEYTLPTGGGTADGVISGLAIDDAGTVTISRTVGADITEDISDNLKDFVGTRAQLGSPTVYTEADDEIITTVAHAVEIGDQIIFLTPATIGTAAGDITFGISVGGTEMSTDPLQNPALENVTASDLAASHIYMVVRVQNRWIITEQLDATTLADALTAVMVAAPITVDRATAGQVTLGLADDGVTLAHMADDSVGSDQLVDDSVGSDQIADAAVLVAHLAAAIVNRLIPTPGTTLTLTSPGDTTILSVDGQNVDNAAVLRIDVGTSGGMKAFQAGRQGETLAWASFEGGIGGSNDNPGIAFGPGTGARDVNIYRGGANILQTDDQFRAAGAVFSAVVEGVTPTADNHLATKAYVDAQVSPTPSHPSLLFGTSTDATPEAAELTITGVMGMGTIPAYAGSMYQLIARLDSEGDISSVTYSDDLSQTNQIGAYTKFGSTVDVGGSAYGVWVSNQALTQGADLTITVS